jgi:Amidohydrolase family
MKRSIEVGKFADLAVLSDDYFSVPDEQIRNVESVLTIVGGKVSYCAGKFESLAPPAIPPSLAWCPVAMFGGF